MGASIASIALIMASALGIASAQDKQVTYGICTYSNPSMTPRNCMFAKGYMMNDGNVCDTPDTKQGLYQHGAALTERMEADQPKLRQYDSWCR
ncbi:hypothetical protein BGZ82_009376 [Podila clonocystis]|nr:hypothetical protein BGZ82_009376 [Podila clonocystis]